MARFRALIVLALAIALGGAFAFFTYRYVQQVQRPVAAAPEPVPTAPVVVAAAKLEIGDEIRTEDVRVLQWPKDAVPPGAIADTNDVVGRGLIEGVIESELLLEGKMAPKDAGAGLPPAIPPGMRALSVRVNEVVGVAGYVLPGTRVDVVVTISPSTGGAGGDMTSKIVLTNVLVLAAGTKIERDLENNEPISVTVVTLLVNPAEAERLTLASTEGRIQLALRNPLDQERPSTPGIRAAALITGGGAPAPRRAPQAVQASATAPVPPPPPPPSTIEIIRGDRRSREAVPRSLVSGELAPLPAPEEAPRESTAPPPAPAPAERAPERVAPASVVSQSAGSQE